MMAGAQYHKFNMELPMLWVNLKEFDNDRLAEIILSKGDVQKRKTNVKANMTEWRLDLESKEVSELAKGIKNRVAFWKGVQVVE